MAGGDTEHRIETPSGQGLIARRIHAECDLLRLHALDPARYPHLLESAATGMGTRALEQARHDILFAFPGETFHVPPAAPGHGFLDALARAFAREGVGPTQTPEAAGVPFRGGWFLYLGYELAAEAEPVLRLPASPHRLPTALAVRFPAAVIRDRRLGQTLIISEADDPARLDAMAEDLSRAPAPTEEIDTPVLAGPLDEDPPGDYLAGVATARDYIFAGDVFQVNLSRVWGARLRPGIAHAALHARLRGANPAPFAALATFGDRAIVSSSPERLVRVRAGAIETRPIAGTRPRGTPGADDAALRAELIAHPKERAEHVMLVDLERNDLSRVAVPGSVVVDEMMTLESFAHVHHIVSNVRGTLRADAGPAQVLAALFPGGTITGCPKVRCMEIIAELEGVGRGPYTGALGYLNRDGDMDLNILIRTLVRDGDDVHFRTGAGIVADSEPLRELAETRAKARGLARALGADVEGT